MKARRNSSGGEEEEEGLNSEQGGMKEGEGGVKDDHLSTVVDWLRNTFCIGNAGSILKAAVFQEYKRFCRASKTSPVSPTVFGRFVRKAFPTIKSSRRGPRGRSKHHYRNLNFLRRPSGGKVQDEEEEEEDEEVDLEEEEEEESEEEGKERGKKRKRLTELVKDERGSQGIKSRKRKVIPGIRNRKKRKAAGDYGSQEDGEWLPKGASTTTAYSNGRKNRRQEHSEEEELSIDSEDEWKEEDWGEEEDEDEGEGSDEPEEDSRKSKRNPTSGVVVKTEVLTSPSRTEIKRERIDPDYLPQGTMPHHPSHPHYFGAPNHYHNSYHTNGYPPSLTNIHHSYPPPHGYSPQPPHYTNLRTSDPSIFRGGVASPPGRQPPLSPHHYPQHPHLNPYPQPRVLHNEPVKMDPIEAAMRLAESAVGSAPESGEGIGFLKGLFPQRATNVQVSATCSIKDEVFDPSHKKVPNSPVAPPACGSLINHNKINAGLTVTASLEAHSESEPELAQFFSGVMGQRSPDQAIEEFKGVYKNYYQSLLAVLVQQKTEERVRHVIESFWRQLAQSTIFQTIRHYQDLRNFVLMFDKAALTQLGEVMTAYQPFINQFMGAFELCEYVKNVACFLPIWLNSYSALALPRDLLMDAMRVRHEFSQELYRRAISIEHSQKEQRYEENEALDAELPIISLAEQPYAATYASNP